MNKYFQFRGIRIVQICLMQLWLEHLSGENAVKILSQKTHLYIIWVNVKKSQKHTQLYGLWIQVLPSFPR